MCWQSFLSLSLELQGAEWGVLFKFFKHIFSPIWDWRSKQTFSPMYLSCIIWNINLITFIGSLLSIKLYNTNLTNEAICLWFLPLRVTCKNTWLMIVWSRPILLRDPRIKMQKLVWGSVLIHQCCLNILPFFAFLVCAQVCLCSSVFLMQKTLILQTSAQGY